MSAFNTYWFPLSIVCALSLASADALTKKFFPDYSGWQLVIMRFGGSALLLLPVSLYTPLPPVPLIFWLWIAVLIPFELLAMWLYMRAIRDSPLCLTLPYLAFTPVFNVVTGYIILGETVSFRGFTGILLVVAGAYFLNVDHAGSISLRSWSAPLGAIFRERGSRLMLGVAVIYSLTSVMGKQAMLYATPASFGPFYFTLIGFLLLGSALLCQPKGLQKLFFRWHQVLIVGALTAIMVITHFIAIAHVEVAYFISIKRSSLLFGIVYGALLFGEHKLLRNLFAGSVMLIGMSFIVLS